MNMPLEWAKVLLSWPVVLIVGISLFRKPLGAFIGADLRADRLNGLLRRCTRVKVVKLVRDLGESGGHD